MTAPKAMTLKEVEERLAYIDRVAAQLAASGQEPWIDAEPERRALTQLRDVLAAVVEWQRYNLATGRGEQTLAQIARLARGDA